MIKLKLLSYVALVATFSSASFAQEATVHFKKYDRQKKVDVLIGGKLFTTLVYQDALEKPVLYPLNTAGGEKIFTNDASAKNLTLKKGESVTFRYEVVISNGAETLNPAQLNAIAASFAKK